MAHDAISEYVQVALMCFLHVGLRRLAPPLVTGGLRRRLCSTPVRCNLSPLKN